MVRGADFSVSDVDVIVEDIPELKVDCKAYKAFGHHTLFDEVREKYCKSENDEPVLVTKSSRQIGENVTITLDFFAYLINCHRLVLQTRPESIPCRRCTPSSEQD